MKQFGLIGFPLSHSFSKKYFSEKFEKEGIQDCDYELFEIEKIEGLPELLNRLSPELQGLNVTIPHKQVVIPFMNEMDPVASKIGAVNVIKVLDDGSLKGYNSDYYGFLNSLKGFVDVQLSGLKALVLGTGGASKAVLAALEDSSVEYQLVSRNRKAGQLAYEDLTEEIVRGHKLIINTTPLGMYPNVDAAPAIPYRAIGSQHYLFDLVYNPEETLFMKKGRENGAKALHGLEMLIGQAEKAWEIWNS